MEEDFGSNFITLTDEDGKDVELEHLDTIEHNGAVYMSFFPAEYADENGNEPSEDDESGLIILKVVEVNGEEQLATLDNEDELQEVYLKFMENLFDEEEEA